MPLRCISCMIISAAFTKRLASLLQWKPALPTFFWDISYIAMLVEQAETKRTKRGPTESAHNLVRNAMRDEETELEMVRRHVRRGELIVSRQRELIAYLTYRHLPTRLAENVLFNLETASLAHDDQLDRIISG